MSVEYFLTDHLGSTSITTDNTGAKVSEMRYKSWGEVRYAWRAGQSTTPAYELAKYTFTGQRDYTSDFGLMFYNARWYDPCIMQFNQPDSMIPDPYNPLDWNRYAYARGNPIKYTDPDGHRPCDLVCEGDIIDWNEAKKGSAWYGEWDIKKQKANEKKAEAILYGGTEFAASVLFEPADWAITIKDCSSGNCSPWMLLGMAPFIPGSAGKYVGKYGDELIALVGRKGFDTFNELKKYLGSAGDNMDWHHIVEQSQIVKSGFSPRSIHNTGNVIAVDADVNRKIVNGFYSSIRPFTEGMTVRNWLAGQNFETQYDFGLQVLRDFGVIP